MQIAKKARKTRSWKSAGLTFLAGRIYKKLKKTRQGMRIFKKAAVFMASVLEYCVAELLDLAGDISKRSKKKRIQPRHIMFGMKMDHEFNLLMKNVIIPGAG